jgi:predicted ferric reductase
VQPVATRVERSWLKPGDVVVALTVLAPLIVAWPRLAPFFGPDPANWVTGIVRATGILGLAMILVAGALSARLPRIDRWFGGLTRLWQLHHLLGFGGLILILLHVLALAFGGLQISLFLAVATLFPPLADIEVWIGWLALAGLLVFLAPSFKFFGQPHYQTWKLLHSVVAPATLVMALLHALPFSIQSASWWVLGALAVGSVVWRQIGARLVVRRAYAVASTDQLTDDVVELTLKPEATSLQHLAGQFVFLTPTDSQLAAGRGEEHPYTLSSAPTEPALRIGIKNLGDASGAMLRIRPGTRVWVEGPYGRFLDRHHPDRAQLWLGGGIGITPFVGAARSMRGDPSLPAGSVHLVYLAQDESRAYYLAELQASAAATPGLVVTPHYFRDEGPISRDFLLRHCPDFAEREIYMCGPSEMTLHLRRLLRGQGVAGSRVHSEEFTFL